VVKSDVAICDLNRPGMDGLERTPEHFGWRRPTWTSELLCLQRDPGAVVGDPELDEAVGLRSTHVDARIRSPRVLERVADEVCEHLLEQLAAVRV
jgi:hypothetical protein